MQHIKNFLVLLLTKSFFKKLIAYIFIILFFYIFRSFLGIFFLTFIFSYLFFSSGKYLKIKFDKFIDKFCKNDKRKKIIKKLFGLNFIVIVLYLIFIGILIFIVSDLLPQLTNELSELNKTIPFVGENIEEINTKLVEIKNFNTELLGTFIQIFESKDYEVILNVFKSLKTAGYYILQFVISLILSFIFIIDRKKLGIYLYRIKKSSFSFLYKEYTVILEKIVMSFGLIFKAQAMIALINATLTIIGLVFIGLLHSTSFPFLLTLGLIVFLAGFIPVLGVFISSIPILIIAFSFIGGYSVIIEIVLLIFIVHMLEAYYLNPKIVSRFLEIPVSLTFIILLLSEHVFGMAGLLIGVSLFYFIIGLLGDFDRLMTKKSKIIKKQKSLTK